MNSRLKRLLSCAFLISTAQAADHFWDEIPQSPSTTRPAEVLDDYWNGEYKRVNREVAAAQNSQVVFFGDSITWSWSLGPATGKDIWQNHFAAYEPINMGNSGDITPVMLHRVTRGNLDFANGQHPKVAVLLCGINNFGVTKSAGGKETWDLGADCPVEDIAHGQRAIAQVFRRKLPHTRVIMMALLPVADPVKWEKCKRVNEINTKLAMDSNEVVYLNLQDSFLLPDATFNQALYADGIHLNKEGYQAWEKGITPLIEKFIQAPPLAPTKIMFIGASLTEGHDSNTSYRRPLDPMLRKSGYLIDMVGSRHQHNNDQTKPDSYQFDTDHEGHWGKKSAWIADNMPRLLEKNVPDVAVIHLGAEDIAASTMAAEPLTDAIILNIDRVIQSLGAKNEKVKIVIAEPLVAEDKKEIAELLNKKILTLARSSASALQPVVVAQANPNLDRKQDIVEGSLLPNASGATKIAASLADAIKPLLEPHQNQAHEK
jgi:lysophospholipase L1-like esterase